MPATVVSTALNAVPGIGGTLGTIADGIAGLFGIGIKGSTQHMSWDDANKASIQMGQQIYDDIKELKLTTQQVLDIGQEYMKNTIAWLTTKIGWNDNQVEDPRPHIDLLKTHMGKPDTVHTDIPGVTWHWAMVELRNMDKNSPGQWQGDYGYILRHTIIPAIEKVTGAKVDQNFSTGGTAVTSGSPSGSGPTGSVTSSVQSAIAGLGNVGGLVLIVIVLGVLFALFRRGSS